MEVTITSENFETLKKGDKPLVIDFWATWCGPCRMIAPIIEKMAKKYEGQIVVGKCDVEENEDLATMYNIRNIPTVLFVKSGVVIDNLVGAQGEAVVDEKFQALL